MNYIEQGSGITFRFIRDGARGWFVLAVRAISGRHGLPQTWQSPDFRTREEAQEWVDDLNSRENDD